MSEIKNNPTIESPNLRDDIYSNTEQEPKAEHPSDKFVDMSPSSIRLFLNKVEHSGELEAFFSEHIHNPTMVALFSYWEKWLSKKQQAVFERTWKAKEAIAEKTDIPDFLGDRFSEEERAQIFKNLTAFQITYGCSFACKFCSVDAVPGVKGQMPFHQIEHLVKKYGEPLAKNRAFFYLASDPSNYKDPESGKTYEDVQKLAHEQGWTPYISTVSYQNDRQWDDFFIKHNGRKRLSRHLNKAQKKVPEFNVPNLDQINTNVKVFENIGVHYNEEKDTQMYQREQGNGCFDGTFITPRGVYGMLVMPISSETPQSLLPVPIDRFDDTPLKIGEKITHAITRGWLPSHHYTREQLNKSFVNFLSDTYQLEQDGKKFYVALDQELRITEMVESEVLDVDLAEIARDMSLNQEEKIVAIRNYYEALVSLHQKNSFGNKSAPVQTVMEILSSKINIRAFAPDTYKRKFGYHPYVYSQDGNAIFGYNPLQTEEKTFQDAPVVAFTYRNEPITMPDLTRPVSDEDGVFEDSKVVQVLQMVPSEDRIKKYINFYEKGKDKTSVLYQPKHFLNAYVVLMERGAVEK